MTVSKQDYMGLEKLSQRISQKDPPTDALVKYFLCLCAGETRGNGAIAAKTNIAPARADSFRAWLIKGNLISMDGAPTEYGTQELYKLVLEREDYVVGLLSDGMGGELDYLLGLEPKGNPLQHKEPEIIPPATIPERHDEPITKTPLSGYVEKKEMGGDILTNGEPSGPELLEAEPVKKKTRRTSVETEHLKYAVLEQINRGVLRNDVIARNVGGDISPGYVSAVVHMLREEGYVEGGRKKRHTTPAGTERLYPYKAKETDVPAKAEPEVQAPEVKSLAEAEPVQIQDTKNPFPSFSYHGLAKKNPRGTKELTKIINRRGYGWKPPEGPYVKAGREPETGEELTSIETLIEEPGVPEESPGTGNINKTQEAPSTKIIDIIGTREVAADDNLEEPEIIYDETYLRALKLLMGIKLGLNKEELKILFGGESELYIFEKSVNRRNNLFQKERDTYSLKDNGRSKLDTLEEEYREFVAEYSDLIIYVKKNKSMPPVREPEKPVPAAPEDIKKSAGEQIQKPKELAPPPAPALVSAPVPQEDPKKIFLRSTSYHGIAKKEELTETGIVDIINNRGCSKKPELIRHYTKPEEEIIELKEPLNHEKNATKIKPIEAHPLQARAKPTQDVKLSEVIKFLEEHADAINAVGLQRAGIRCVAHFDDHQRIIFANKRFQKIGGDYLGILSGNNRNESVNLEKYQELKYLGWITGNNGDTTKTEKGENAQHLLEQFISLSNMVA